MNRLRVAQKAQDIEGLDLRIEPFEPACSGPGDVVVEIHSAGVNPSDVKACLGLMPHAIWPRTPGRDWAGLVVDGPGDLVGHAVWGSGGDLGITRDGSHGSHLVIDRRWVRPKPSTVTLREAGAIGVPFVTAYEGLRRAGLPKPGETVLVLGANGKVGQAAVQIAAMRGARVFAAQRRSGPYQFHAAGPVDAIDAASEDVAAALRSATDGHGADIVYNTVGSPYFEAASQALALGGRHILIATVERRVPFDILGFYRGRHMMVGIDSLALDGAEAADILDALAPGFESGALRPFPVVDASCFALTEAKTAYRAVLAGSEDRIVLVPDGVSAAAPPGSAAG
ncbi:MAG TPA: zinc-binding alcohol dehydrogenase family protein [Aliidongia sp.]|nr:zinc-binding alcohol dehydrogenase family protein [Aliidongia sp.]